MEPVLLVRPPGGCSNRSEKKSAQLQFLECCISATAPPGTAILASWISQAVLCPFLDASFFVLHSQAYECRNKASNRRQSGIGPPIRVLAVAAATQDGGRLNCTLCVSESNFAFRSAEFLFSHFTCCAIQGKHYRDGNEPDCGSWGARKVEVIECFVVQCSFTLARLQSVKGSVCVCSGGHATFRLICDVDTLSHAVFGSGLASLGKGTTDVSKTAAGAAVVPGASSPECTAGYNLNASACNYCLHR